MDYIKEALKRGLMGIFTGLVLSHTLFLLAALKQDTLSVSSSMYIQHYLTYGILGFYFSSISILFSIEKWSLLRQFVTHIGCTLPFLPIAYMIDLMPGSLLGKMVFIGLYFAGYIISFIIYMHHLKQQARAINTAL